MSFFRKPGPEDAARQAVIDPAQESGLWTESSFNPWARLLQCVEESSIEEIGHYRVVSP